MLLRKLFFKSNGAPRPWLKRILFDEYLQLKGSCRWFVLDSRGDTRKAFSDWYSLVLHNPDPAIDPRWSVQRDELLKSGPFGDRKTITVVSPNATLYVARMLGWQLSSFNLRAELVTEMPQHFGDGLYIVICPQTYKRLPPREQRIVFQMEQSVSARWFTQEYLNVLYNSLAVFDYSQKNIKYLQEKKPGLINLYHVPIEPIPANAIIDSGSGGLDEDKSKYDIVFYGDAKISRRKIFLSELERHFKVNVITNIYGAELWGELQKAIMVVNIHYYENALLETTRISESLSLGLTVISEESSDQYEHKNLSDRVIFTPINDVAAMILAIKKELITFQLKSKKKFNNENFTGANLKMALNSLGIKLEG
jgi:hypothetical protein